MYLYDEIKTAGIPTDNHESDLYFPITEQSTEILARYPLEKSNASRFINQVAGGWWYDVPFAFIPFWTARQGKAVTR